jgi:hypothetical protein
MRFHLLLVLTGLVVSACALGGGPSPPRASTNYMAPIRTATYMTPEQPGKLVTMPGDSTTVVQMRSPSTTSLNDHSGPLFAVWPQQ